MAGKMLVDKLPDMGWAYPEIIQFLFNYRTHWTVKGISCEKYSDFRETFTKREMIEYIKERFDLSVDAKKQERDELIKDIPAYDVYEVKYIGRGDIIRLDTVEGSAYFKKDVRYTIYGSDNPLIDQMRERGDFVMQGRALHSAEKTYYDLNDKLQFDRSTVDEDEKFFKVW